MKKVVHSEFVDIQRLATAIYSELTEYKHTHKVRTAQDIEELAKDIHQVITACIEQQGAEISAGAVMQVIGFPTSTCLDYDTELVDCEHLAHQMHSGIIIDSEHLLDIIHGSIATKH